MTNLQSIIDETGRHKFREGLNWYISNKIAIELITKAYEEGKREGNKNMDKCFGLKIGDSIMFGRSSSDGSVHESLCLKRVKKPGFDLKGFSSKIIK